MEEMYVFGILNDVIVNHFVIIGFEAEIINLLHSFVFKVSHQFNYLS